MKDVTIREVWKTIRYLLLVPPICVTIVFIFYAVYMPEEMKFVIDYGDNIVKVTEDIKQVECKDFGCEQTGNFSRCVWNEYLTEKQIEGGVNEK